MMRRSQIKAVRPAIARKPAVAQKAATTQRQGPVGNHALAGPAPDRAPSARASPDLVSRDLASIVQQARAAPRAHIPHAGAVARDFGLPLSALEIHAGGAAEAACRVLDARAFVGDNDALTLGTPIAVQCNGLDEEPTPTPDDDKSGRQRAEERLRHLAEEIELKTFEGATDALFGITRIVEGDQPAAETDSAIKKREKPYFIDFLCGDPRSYPPMLAICAAFFAAAT